MASTHIPLNIPAEVRRTRPGAGRDNDPMRRTDDTFTDYPRKPDRIECEDDRWYVRTREGRRGPFGSRRAVEAEAALFVDTMAYLQQAQALPPNLDCADVEVVNIDRMPWR